MVTSRDRIALDFIEQFHVATPSQVAKVAYDNNLKICYNRLNRLHDDKLLYKTPNTLNKGFIYSNNRIRTTKQFLHDFYRVEFYLKLIEASKILFIETEKRIDHIRPDILVSCIYNDVPYHFAVEVETNANKSCVNYDKYNEFFLKEWRKHFKVKPVVIYITNKKIDSNKIHFEYRSIRTDLSNFTDIFM